MTTALVLGYSAFDLGLFSDKDPRLKLIKKAIRKDLEAMACLLYTSPSPRDPKTSRMPSSA